MKGLFFFLLLFIYEASSAQIINTWAGNGTNVNNGDGAAAINAGIYNPTWGVFDKDLNYYVVSPLGHRIRKISANGIITTVAGTGTSGYNGDNILAINAKINGPGSVIVDTSGSFFIADGQNNRVRKVDITSGLITTIAGTGIQGFSGDSGLAVNATFNGPNDICSTNQGIYIYLMLVILELGK